MISLIRRAQSADVPLVTDKGGIVPVGKLEKACQIAEGVPDNTDTPAPAPAPAPAPTATYDAEAWRQQEDALQAAQLEVSRLRAAIAQAAESLKLRHYKEAAKILLAA
jgi:pyruvate/2-oxoglutarate dehydrogenase complex dihydrolipoamide acyltransferase (E2) component